jgi:hypothetical protein
MSVTAFQRFVCWDPGSVEEVMETEALQTPDHVFLATHHPIRMYRTDLGSEGARVEYGEQPFLRDFLAPQDFTFVAVLGEAGTGKSHMIRWLAGNIPSTVERRVLLIPKVGTNLKEVIRRILEGLEGSPFDEYRKRMEQATGSLSEGEARVRLLDNLGVALGPYRYTDRSGLTPEQDYLVDHLPGLLSDPVIRRHLLRDGGIMQRLVVHILGHSGRVERLEERRAVSEDDLQMDVRDLDRASAEAQETFGFLLSDEEMRREAVAWMNRHLDDAIAQVLQFSGEDLLRLMLEVREALAEAGTELVILIEDFAKLQGIDRQLLEALLVQPYQEGRRRLCALRTALAVTSGYFDDLPETVRDRIHFRVSMDRDADAGRPLFAPEEVETFASRYLNAVRVGSGALARWHVEGRDADPVPNACEQCPHQEPCHVGFGARHGVGLYPFNGVALRRMQERASPGGFNPRRLINRVLKTTLEEHAEDLRHGEFPSPALLARMGGSTLGALTLSQLRQRDREHAGRREALLEFWNGEGRVVDLHPAIHGAFDLPPLGTPDTSSPEPKRTRQEETPVDPDRLPDAVGEQIQALDEWGQGKAMPQGLANALRPGIYQATSHHIDWESRMLLQGAFRGAGGKPFQPRSIHFARGTQPAPVPVQLRLPVRDEEINDTVIALQALVLYTHYRHWNFREGGRYLRAYVRQLDRWSEVVVDGIQRTRVSGEQWDPVPAAVELLAIGARLAGRPRRDGTLVDHVSVLFEDWSGEDVRGRSPSWQSLFDTFRRHRPVLVEVVRARTACTKGGSSDVKVIDSAQLVPVLARVRKSWTPEIPVPPDVRSEYAAIRDVRARVDELLQAAIVAERQRYLQWYERVVERMGDPPQRRAVVETLREAVAVCTASGTPLGIPVSEFDETGSTLERMNSFDWCISAVQRVREETDFGALLAELGRRFDEPMQVTDRFLELADRFLDSATRRIEGDLRDLRERGGGELGEVQGALGDGLGSLRTMIGTLAEGAGC